DKFYTDIIRALTESAKRVVPSHQHNFYKFWWNEELSLLKQNSIDSYKLWTSGGKPRSGFLFDNMSKNKRVYKIAIKNNEMSNRDIFSNALNEALLDKDTDNFWKSWRSKFGKDKVNSLVIDGECSANIIVQNFCCIFKEIIVPNSSEKHNALKTNFFTQFKDYSSDVRSDFICDSSFIDSCIKKLKLGKAAGCDGLTTEHLVHAHPILIELLSILFRMILMQGVVPSDFGKGIIIPLVKNIDGDKSCGDNYRGITLSPVISKIFELVIIHLLDEKLDSSELQFGFKARSSCNHAIFALRSVVKHFCNNFCTVILCAFDISKV